MESWIRDDNHEDGSIPSHIGNVSCKENHEENRLQYLDVRHSQVIKFSIFSSHFSLKYCPIHEFSAPGQRELLYLSG